MATKPVIRFRNYKPNDASLQAKKPAEDDLAGQAADGENGSHAASAAATAATGMAPSSSMVPATATATAGSDVGVDAPAGSKRKRAEEGDVIKRELAQHTEEELNIVPKKPNWDLKSQVEDRIQKLKRRTQRAIVEILREKLAAESRNDDDDDEY